MIDRRGQKKYIDDKKQEKKEKSDIEEKYDDKKMHSKNTLDHTRMKNVRIIQDNAMIY